jgi:hypothetical protein
MDGVVERSRATAIEEFIRGIADAPDVLEFRELLSPVVQCAFRE